MEKKSYPAFGLFSKTNFLDDELCKKIRLEMASSEGNPSLIAKGDETQLDEKVRRTVDKDVSKDTRDLLTDKFTGIKGELEAFFDISLSHSQDLRFLYYREGDFFELHNDSGTSSKNTQEVKDRKVSAILFLNDETDEHGDDSFVGGSFLIYGILSGPQFESHGFKVPGKKGTLIAFRSDLFHEVTPVTGGVRYTIVGWFA